VSWYLAVDTATERGSVAVGRPGSVACEIILGPRRHAAALVPSIEEALRLAGQSLGDITGVLVADGPGSFTGLRIAWATVQGIVRERPDLTVMTAPSLLGAARLASPFASGPVAALFDALRGEVFAAVYQFRPESIEIVSPPELTTVRALRGSGVRAELAVGDGAAVQADEVRAWTGRDPVAPPEGGPRATGLIELLRTPGALRTLDDVAAWEPAYGRPAEAQTRWERTHGKPLPGSVSDRG
jgi:tRNA threonylcarbamoyladenosine biosynthesis protein TsaB